MKCNGASVYDERGPDNSAGSTVLGRSHRTGVEPIARGDQRGLSSDLRGLLMVAVERTLPRSRFAPIGRQTGTNFEMTADDRRSA